MEIAELYERINDIATALLFYKKSLQFQDNLGIKDKIQCLYLVKGV
jgi:hypothetical protein